MPNVGESLGQGHVTPTKMELREDERDVLQLKLLAWFEHEQREFPWRRARDPYAVLIAEKLLQQTSARGGVTEAFQGVLERYPTPHALCEANLVHLERFVAPLGLRYRAREMRDLACVLVARHGGQVPMNLRELLALPGVGDYSARAVLCFAGNQDIAIVDVNVARLLHRIFDISGPLPPNPARKKALVQAAESLVPVGRGRLFNLAVLDLCAAVCTVSGPKCAACPILAVCRYGQRNIKGRGCGS